MDQAYKALLEKQGYKFIGEHSACKVCYYTKSSLKGKANCYKNKFYGIKSHRCVQMTVAANFCNLDCVFCWRKRNNSSFGKIDDPVEIASKAVDAQNDLLVGLKGYEGVDPKKFAQSKKPLHFAISLNGENTAYPRLSEFIDELNKKGHSSYLVSNGQLPAVLEKLSPPTQLYISVSASNEKDFIKIDRPLLEDGWQRLLKSLDVLNKLGREKKTRTVLRLTVVKDLSMKKEHAKEYAQLIKRANPMFLEIKSYSWLGTSRERLEKSNEATYQEIIDFASQIGKYCDYKFVDGQEEARVVLCMKEDLPDRFLKFD